MPIYGERALDTAATVIPLAYDRLAEGQPPYRVRRQNRAILAWPWEQF